MTAIAWADATLNTGNGCTRISPGCKNCYMFRILDRQGINPHGAVPVEDWRLEKRLKALGKRPKRVFLNSMTDTFHEHYPNNLIEHWLDMLWDTPHYYMILTKRAERMRDFFNNAHDGFVTNLFLGVSVESPKQYPRIDHLRKTCGPELPTRFLSIEPLLESVRDIDLSDIDWVLVGGESDLEAPRPMKTEWALELRDLCRSLNIPFFFKQSGGSTYTKDPETGNMHWGTDLLEGKEYKEFPDAPMPPPLHAHGLTGQSTLEGFA